VPVDTTARIAQVRVMLGEVQNQFSLLPRSVSSRAARESKFLSGWSFYEHSIDVPRKEKHLAAFRTALTLSLPRINHIT